jgi:hypothetical protein
MKFYKLENLNEAATTGPVYPQIAEYKNWCYDNYNYLLAELGPDKLPDKDFVLDYLKLDHKAILTDFLSVYNPIRGFIFSDNAKQIFDKFNLPQHKYFKTIVEADQRKLNNYFWLYMISQNVDKIIFPKSTFKLMKGLLPTVLGTKKFSSVEEIAEFEKLNPRIKVRPLEIYIESEKNKTDIFQIRKINFDWIISDKLAEALSENKVTGCQITEIDWLKIY